ncbi:protein translocase SEC61 complex subunit gamma [Candidatus Woesearchaeota archaeon]|nr:protein translocase SEC61 complex subunit gamma [Candidatus Woesearchaeota archaeon]
MEEQKPEEAKTYEFKADEKLNEEIKEQITEKKEKKSWFKKPELPKKLVKQPANIGQPLPSKKQRIKRFFQECIRVLRVTKKPDKQEFLTIVKVSALGMAVIGVIGFLISLAKELMFK